MPNNRQGSHGPSRGPNGPRRSGPYQPRPNSFGSSHGRSNDFEPHSQQADGRRPAKPMKSGGYHPARDGVNHENQRPGKPMKSGGYSPARDGENRENQHPGKPMKSGFRPDRYEDRRPGKPTKGDFGPARGEDRGPGKPMKGSFRPARSDDRRDDRPFTPRPKRMRPSEDRFNERDERPAMIDDYSDDAPENLLVGRNPIREALKSGRALEKLLVAKGDLSGSARELIAMAKERKVVVVEVDRRKLDQIARGHQGMLAYTSAHNYATVEEIMELARTRNQAPLIVVLDGVTDPHNFGAIIRSAECAGAHGVIVAQRRSAGLSPIAAKASAGALEYLPIARVPNIVRTLEDLKKQGLWIVGADMSGQDMGKIDWKQPTVLVIGGEGEGMARLTREHCDFQAAIPILGQIQSLNASVATGVLLYEAVRQRQ